MKLPVLPIPLSIWIPWFKPLLFWRISPCIIYPFPVNPDLPSIDQAGTYSSACTISRLPPFSVSYNNRSHTVQESFPINVARTFVDAFNVEVMFSPWTNPTLYPRACPISGSALEAAFDDVSFFPFRPWDAEDMVILDCIPRLFGILILVLGNYFPQRGPWVLMESGLGPQIL